MTGTSGTRSPNIVKRVASLKSPLKNDQRSGVGIISLLILNIIVYSAGIVNHYFPKTHWEFRKKRCLRSNRHLLVWKGQKGFPQQNLRHSGNSFSICTPESLKNYCARPPFRKACVTGIPAANTAPMAGRQKAAPEKAFWVPRSCFVCVFSSYRNSNK